MPYDIAIIGAGPAGCTLARLLDRKYKVILLDKRDILAENCSSKCCGGLLAPDAQKILGRMGLAIPSSVLVDPQLFLVRAIDFDNNLERYYQRFYFNMDRLVFEQWLLSSVPKNVDLALGCTFKTCEYTGEAVRFTFTYQGKTYSEYAKVIIGADGAHSLVRKSLFPEKKTPETYVAIQEWFEIDKPMPWYGVIFDSTITDFYSWTITKGKILIIGSALKKSNLAVERFRMLKMKLRDNGLSYGKRILREGSLILRPASVSSVITGNEYCALAGEAAGFISPSSAEGISYALKSAYFLAEALNEDISDFQRSYSKSVSKLKINLIGKNMKSRAMYNRFLRGIVMRSGIKSTDVLF